MKKKTVIISASIALSVAVLALIFLLSFEQTEMNFAQKRIIVYLLLKKK